MTLELQQLIDKIKSEGVEEATRQADSIIEKAREKAKGIIDDAHDEAERIVVTAREQSARSQDAGKKALEQAGRNLILGLRKNINTLFEHVLKREVSEALDPKLLSSMLEKIALNWDHTKQQGIEALLSERDFKLLENDFLQKLQKKIKGGVTLKPVDTIDAGFQIGRKNDNTYFDFTDAGIATMLSQYLNPALASLLSDTQAQTAE